MKDMLDAKNKHLFLEKSDIRGNSFIYNVNILTRKLMELIRLNEIFNDQRVIELTALAELDVNQIIEDLAKKAAQGNRKIDIDLLKNFKNYSDQLTPTGKRELWADPDSQVYYEGVDVYFEDYSSIHKDFVDDSGYLMILNDHRELLQQLFDWPELRQRYGNTKMLITEATDLYEHELLRIVDGELPGSRITSVTLWVSNKVDSTRMAPELVGAKESKPNYTWADSTSCLMVMITYINKFLMVAKTSDDVVAVAACLSEIMILAEYMDQLVLDEDSVYNYRAYIAQVAANMSDVKSAKALLDNMFAIERRITTMDADVVNRQSDIIVRQDNIKQLQENVINEHSKAINAIYNMQTTALARLNSRYSEIVKSIDTIKAESLDELESKRLAATTEVTELHNNAMADITSKRGSVLSEFHEDYRLALQQITDRKDLALALIQNNINVANDNTKAVQDIADTIVDTVNIVDEKLNRLDELDVDFNHKVSEIALNNMLINTMLATQQQDIKTLKSYHSTPNP